MKKKIGLISALLMTHSAYSSEYIVKLKKGATQSFMKNGLVSNYGEMKSIPTSFGDFVKVENHGAVDIIEQLKKDPNVLYVERNKKLHLINPVNVGPAEKLSQLSEDTSTQLATGETEPLFSKQWGLKNTGANSGSWYSPGKVGMDLNAATAWKSTNGNEELIIAVIDTGVDYNHPDLKANMWVNPDPKAADVHGYNFVNDTPDPMDDHSHGTHCAGNIGAAHDGQGIAGMMGKVKIMALKFLSKDGSGETEGAIKAVDYAIKHGAKIMSNSWGGDEKSQALEDAVAAANEKGIVFVAAAGNESNNNDSKATYPASIKQPNVITVGAMSGTGSKAGFSNYGAKTVHVFAPGTDIYSSVPGESYEKMSGTSMATPFVAGVVGLMMSVNKTLTPAQIKEKLIQTSVAVPKLKGVSVSNGRVDAATAVSSAAKSLR